MFVCITQSRKKKDPDKRKERKTETGEYGWTVLFHFQFEWFHYLDIIRPRSAHSPFLLWTFHSERISFCRCISIRSLAYFSRTHVLTQHWIKANCSTGHGWFIHTFAFSFFIFLPKKRKTYPPTPNLVSILHTFGKLADRGTAWIVVTLSIWMGLQLRGQLR